MLSSSEAYKDAIVGAVRHIVPRAVIDLVSPDTIYNAVTASGQAYYSKPTQLYDKVFGPPKRYATLECDRWALDGNFDIFPDTVGEITADIGFIGDVLCDGDGVFTSPVWVQLNMSNVSILQACSVWFSEDKLDGVPADFTVEIIQGGTVYHNEAFTGNTATSVSVDGFTVYNPDAIRVTVTKWSIPYRRFRAVEIVPGIYGQWDGNTVFSLDIMEQADFSCTSLPFTTATLEIYNENRRFDPRNKSGLFLSIEERQGIPLWMGVETDAGVEYIPRGVFYQQSGGWTIVNNGLTMRWKLVSIVGLLANRKFRPPAVLPTTLDSWLAEIVSQLGVNFVGRYRTEKGSTSLTCSLDDVENITCGDLLRFICQASGTYPKTDPETGYLWAATLPSETANKVTLDNLGSFPGYAANDDLSAVIFKIGETQHVIAGTNTASGKTVSINNPFIKTVERAGVAARNIIVNYGGNKITTKGRGDMTSEVGDVDIVEVDTGLAVSGRRHKQQFRLIDGVMKDVQSEFLQATGEEIYTSYEVLKNSGTWTAPESVTRIRLVLVGRGEDGQPGTAGTWDKDGTPGTGGLGGKILFMTIDINSGQQFSVNIDAETTFGAHSSANGQHFDGYAEIGANLAFGLKGADGSGLNALPNTGNGGGGGQAGQRGISGQDTEGNYYVRRYPTDGKPGASGGSGCVVVYYDK